MDDPKLEWDPSIAALIAKWRESANQSSLEATRIYNTVKGHTEAQERCYVRADMWKKCADQLESAASALTVASHVWDRNAPTVPHLGQMLPQDIDVARTFNESSDPRAMLAFIKLLAVGRAHRIQESAASALRGVRQDDQKDQEARSANQAAVGRLQSSASQDAGYQHDSAGREATTMTRLTTAQREQKEADRQVALLKQITEDAHRTAREETARSDIGFVPPMDQSARPETIQVPTVPGPRKQLCYVSPPLDGSGGNPMLHCDRAAGHGGLHLWELTARLEKAEAELSALRGVRVTNRQIQIPKVEDQDSDTRRGTMEISASPPVPHRNAGDSSSPVPEETP